MEKEMFEKIGKLEKELENVNDFFFVIKCKGVILFEEEFVVMFFIVVVVVKIVKFGMKLIEFYNVYVEI